MSEDTFKIDRMVRIDVKFFVKGEPYGVRQWVAVPRVGDEVMLGPHGQKKPYKVKRVVWGVEGPEELYQRQAVNIDVVEIK